MYDYENKFAEKWKDDSVVEVLLSLKENITNNTEIFYLKNALYDIGYYPELWNYFKNKFNNNIIVSGLIKEIESILISNLINYLDENPKIYKSIYSKDPKYRFKKNVCALMAASLKRRGVILNIKTTKIINYILGYTFDELIEHIEQTFKAGMSWGNYGQVWHLDHIIPRKSFVIESIYDESLKKCWGLNNLRAEYKIMNLQMLN